jgi:hypothetical protein
LRDQLPLPGSTIRRLGFPNDLPSKTTEPNHRAGVSYKDDDEDDDEGTTLENELFSGFYEAEIMIRKSMNQAFKTMGEKGEAKWIDDTVNVLFFHNWHTERMEFQ